jgi:uncharacterized membrane protein YfcA
VNGYVVIGSAVVGLLVGLTGAGGGALMTPMLILLFSVKPSAAISSDLVAAVVMRPVGAAVHLKKGTVNTRLAGWICVGSVPAAFLGSWLLHQMGNGKAATTNIERALGAALLLGCAAMALRAAMDRRSGASRDGDVSTIKLKPLPTVAIGIVGGLVVGLTSVGAGSLMIVLLMFAYPTLAARRLVGTDLVQAIPLTGSAALGALIFGHVQIPLTLSIIIGSVPAVLVGSLLSSRLKDTWLRPVIFFVILLSGLKYAGMATRPLGITALIAAAVLIGGALVLRARSSAAAPTAELTGAETVLESAPAGRMLDPRAT